MKSCRPVEPPRAAPLCGRIASGLELTEEQHRVRFAVIGTDSASLGHGFGVDCLELRP